MSTPGVFVGKHRRKPSLSACFGWVMLGAFLGVGAAGHPAFALSDTFSLVIAETTAEESAVSDFYAARAFAPLWTGPSDTERRAAFFTALSRVEDHGLPAARYDAASLIAQFNAVQSEAQRARLEVAMTRVFLTYARDVQTGFLTPSEIDPTIVRAVPRRDPRIILDAFAATDPKEFLDSLPPSVPQYAELQRARLDLIGAISAGGFGPTVDAEKLEPGDEGPAVVTLRDRLIKLGYLGQTSIATYDDALARAVQMFQLDHGLTSDGVAGESTISEVNRSAQDRLKSVLVGLERLRWMNGTSLGDRYVWVNEPDFTAKIIDNGRVTFESVTVVGQPRPDTRSPEFSDEIEFMVVNPTWSVPRSITVKEYLPMLQKDPNAAGHLRIVDRSGRLVDRTQVDFTQFTAANFPFSMSQAPSDGNALGLVKFMFPNKWNIYLHDTPQKPLFKKESRAFSHGCIRLGDPFGFAYALLARQSADPKGLFASYLNTRREAVLPLAQKVPVHLVYFTAWPNARGHIDYRRDVYGRDAAVFDAMQALGVALPGVQG